MKYSPHNLTKMLKRTRGEIERDADILEENVCLYCSLRAVKFLKENPLQYHNTMEINERLYGYVKDYVYHIFALFFSGRGFYIDRPDVIEGNYLMIVITTPVIEEEMESTFGFFTRELSRNINTFLKNFRQETLIFTITIEGNGFEIETSMAPRNIYKARSRVDDEEWNHQQLVEYQEKIKGRDVVFI